MEALILPKPTLVAPPVSIRYTSSRANVSAPLCHRHEAVRRNVGTQAVDLGVAAGAVVAAAATTAALYALAQRDGTVSDEVTPVSIK